MSKFTADKTLDCKGLSCPMPIVRTKKMMDELEAGQVLEVIATDPGSVADIKGWAQSTGHHHLGSSEEGGAFRHYLRKAGAGEVKDEREYTRTTTNADLMQNLGNNPVILDVRELDEYAQAHVPGAKFTPLSNLEEAITALNLDKDQEIHVYCRSGSRSNTACLLLEEKGYKNAVRVLPGMSEWTGPVGQAPMMVQGKQENGSTLIVFSGDLDKAIASFIIANGSAAMGGQVTMFFTFWGLNVLRRDQYVPGKKTFLEKMFGKMMPRGPERLGISNMNFLGMGSKLMKYIMKQKNIATLPELIELAKENNIKMVACTMSMDVLGITEHELIDGIDYAGVAAYLADAEKSKVNLFI